MMMLINGSGQVKYKMTVSKKAEAPYGLLSVVGSPQSTVGSLEFIDWRLKTGD